MPGSHGRYDAGATVKTCPYCAEDIQDDATMCRYCGAMLGVPSDTTLPPEPALLPPGPTALPTGPSPTPSRVGDEALQFSHSGQRYLLGYGETFFGIWDRLLPGAPVRRFPRTDEGWREAWLAYVGMEPNHAEVGVGGAVGRPSPTTGWQQPGWPPTSSGWSPPEPRPTRPVSGAWWLLPILLGWLGGFIAWIVNKENDPKTARAMLFVGIAISVIGVLLVMATLPSFDGA